LIGISGIGRCQSDTDADSDDNLVSFKIKGCADDFDKPRHERCYLGRLNAARLKDGKFIAAWKQFGRPSGLWVDQNDMLYTVDSQSSNDPKSPNYNGDCKTGIRIGSVKDGKVTAYIPPPPVADPKLQPPEGITVDSHGTIYAAAQQQNDIKKYLKN